MNNVSNALADVKLGISGQLLLIIFIAAFCLTLLIVVLVDRKKKTVVTKNTVKTVNKGVAAEESSAEDGLVKLTEGPKTESSYSDDNKKSVSLDPVKEQREDDPIRNRLMQTLNKDNREFEVKKRDDYVKVAAGINESADNAPEEAPVRKVPDSSVLMKPTVRKSTGVLPVKKNDEIKEILGDIDDDSEDTAIKMKITNKQVRDASAVRKKTILCNDDGTDKVIDKKNQEPSIPIDAISSGEITEEELIQLMTAVSKLSPEEFLELPEEVQEFVTALVARLDNTGSSESVDVSIDYAAENPCRAERLSATTFSFKPFRIIVNDKVYERSGCDEVHFNKMDVVKVLVGASVKLPVGCLASINLLSGKGHSAEVMSTLSWNATEPFELSFVADSDGSLSFNDPLVQLVY